MMSEKFQWSKEKVKVLIEKYKSLPELWDSRCNLYENRIKKQNALLKLANDLEIDEREIQRKIYNLRTQFFQEYKKIKKRPLGSKQCGVKWEFYDSLKFILSSHLRRKPADTARGDHRTENTPINPKMDTSSSSENLCSSPEPPIERSQMKRRINEANLPDEYQIFGNYVASELRNIKSPIIRRKLKRALQLAIVQHSEMDDNNTYMSAMPSSSSSPLIQHENSPYFIKQGPPSIEQTEQDLPSTMMIEGSKQSRISVKEHRNNLAKCNLSTIKLVSFTRGGFDSVWRSLRFGGFCQQRGYVIDSRLVTMLTDSIRLPKMTRILTKITDQNKPFYINANYKDNEIEIVILQNSKAWKCSVTEGMLNEWSKKHQKSFTDYFGTLKAYLNSPPEGVSLCLNNNEFVVYRSLNRGRTKFISINLEEIDYVGVVEETLVRFSDENRNYRNKIEELEAQQTILDQSNAEYLGKLQEFIERKERDDEQLYSNFVQVLNEKKRKIQHLTELLEGFRNCRSTESPTVDTKRRKRKKDDDTPETSNQRKEVLSESDESNYESEEEMEQEQTSSSDDSDRNVAVDSHDSKIDDFVLPKRIINTEIKAVEVRVANSATVEDVEPEIVENKRRKPNLDDTQELLDAI